MKLYYVCSYICFIDELNARLACKTRSYIYIKPTLFNIIVVKLVYIKIEAAATFDVINPHRAQLHPAHVKRIYTFSLYAHTCKLAVEKKLTQTYNTAARVCAIILQFIKT